MALNLKLPKVFGKDKAAAAAAADLDMPTTQVRASQAQAGYDPLASVSIMEQLRTATTEMKMPRRLPVIGHLPIVQQFQVLGVMMVTFFVFAAFMVFLDGRNATPDAPPRRRRPKCRCSRSAWRAAPRWRRRARPVRSPR